MNRIRRHTAPVLLLAMSLAAAVDAAAQAGEPIGVVMSVDGTWFRAARGTLAVGPGEHVFRGDTLRIRSDFTSRKRVEVLLRGGRYVRFTCPVQGRCDRAFVPADSLRERSRVSRTLGFLADAVFSRFSRNPHSYSDGIVRDGPGANEAVLRMWRGAVDVEPVLRGARAGGYHLHFSPVGGNTAAAVDNPALIAWEGGRDVTVSAEGLAPGLYEVEVRPTGAAERAGARAWVLVAADDYEAREQAFRAIQALVEGWPGAGAAQKRAFLRAGLDCLARGGDGAAQGAGCS